ncbi:MAG TPA: hypothetical protein VFE58_10700 [Tepidisphaeraceae bacterium]|jgi:hypothetical protein|nr:hypothetical protein [Tepidisphaeraceae bacterium]
MYPPDSAQLWQQIIWLFILAIPVACVAWTVTHEEVFREPREFCARKSKVCNALVKRKFFYLFTCEYCFSHYITAVFLYLTGFRLLLDNWVGYIISFFALVFVANAYMSFYNRLRVDINSERKVMETHQREAELKQVETQVKEEELKNLQRQSP